MSRGIPAPGVAWFKNVLLAQPIHQKVHTNRWVLASIWRGLWRHGAHLWVRKSSQVWVKVELDADCGAGQGESSDEQHNEHNIGEGRSEVNHLNRHTCSDVGEYDEKESSSTRLSGETGKKLTAIPVTHLSRRFGPLPDAEVAPDPCDEQAQCQVPVQ